MYGENSRLPEMSPGNPRLSVWQRLGKVLGFSQEPPLTSSLPYVGAIDRKDYEAALADPYVQAQLTRAREKRLSLNEEETTITDRLPQAEDFMRDNLI